MKAYIILICVFLLTPFVSVNAATFFSQSTSLEYTSDGTTEVFIIAKGGQSNGGSGASTCNLQYGSSTLDSTSVGFTGGFNTTARFVGVMSYAGTLPSGTADLTITGCSDHPAISVIEASSGGGTATTSPYTFDVGITTMLGAILMLMIAYWIVGLTRGKTKSWN